MGFGFLMQMYSALLRCLWWATIFGASFAAQAAPAKEDLTDLHNKVVALRTAGKFTEAIQTAEILAELLQNRNRSCDTELAASLAELAALYRESGNVDKALPLMWNALSIDEEALGRDHPVVGLDLAAIADALRDTPRRAEAESLYVRAVAIMENALGPHHPISVRVSDKLAGLLGPLKRFTETKQPPSSRSLAPRDTSMAASRAIP